MYSTAQIVNHTKNQNMDFEFYPTTSEIIETIKTDMEKNFYWSIPNSILDIGAGDGKTLTELSKEFRDSRESPKLLAIEKNPMLRALHVGKSISLLGVDFTETELWNKPIDVIFCNPPYSEYVTWVQKIINEASVSSTVYLVIPSRWKDNSVIKNTIANRMIPEKNIKVLGTFDFLNAERAANAYVDVIRINLKDSNDSISEEISKMFESNQFTKVKSEDEALDKEDKFTNTINNTLSTGSDYVEILYNFYNEERVSLNSSLSKLSELPLDILSSFGLNILEIKRVMKDKISELNCKYWEIIINQVSPIKDKLISRYRNEFIDSLQVSHIDFTIRNVYATIEQILIKTNDLLDKQVLAVYKNITEISDVIRYKSNNKVFVQERFYRSCLEEIGQYKLSPRIITTKYGNGFSRDYSKTNQSAKLAKLTYGGVEFINDILIIARLLGYNSGFNPDTYNWDFGKRAKVEAEINDKNVALCEIKIFKNNNYHIEFNEKFMLQLNIIKGKLEGWVKNAQDIMDEFETSEEEASKYFTTSHHINITTQNLLLLK